MLIDSVVQREAVRNEQMILQYESLTGKQTAELFRRYGVFDYLNEFYDVLHTTGYQYINHDIDIYLKSRNAVIPA